MTNKIDNHKCEKCGMELTTTTAQTSTQLCKTCELKLMYGVTNKRGFRRKK